MSDNAANQLLAVRLLKVNSVSCSAHTIQLAINNALEECPNIMELLKKCKIIVKRFKKSNPCNLLLKKVSYLILLLTIN